MKALITYSAAASITFLASSCAPPAQPQPVVHHTYETRYVTVPASTPTPTRSTPPTKAGSSYGYSTARRYDQPAEAFRAVGP